MSTAESGHVLRTIRALELLAEEPRTQSAVGRELGVHPRTAGRLLRRLVDAGYAAPAEGGRFAATLKLVGLAGRVIERTDVARAAIPFVADLRDRVGAGSYLTVPGDEFAFHVLHEIADSDVVVRSRVGERVPYHAAAAGKALLANRPQAITRIASGDMAAYTPRTITDRAQLLLDLARVRENGYAIEDQEFSIEVRAVAAPVFDHSGTCIASIGLSAPLVRLLESDFEATGAIVSGVAGALSAALGFGLRPRREVSWNRRVNSWIEG